MRIKGQLNQYTSKTKWCQKIQQEVLSRINCSYDTDDLLVDFPKICDPFAADNNFADPFTNDINPNARAYYNLDAIDFLDLLIGGDEELLSHVGYFDLVVFDPPFSFKQAEKYVGSVTNVYTAPAYVSKCFERIYTLLKPGGYVLKFGFNSNRDHVGLELVKYWIVAHGGNHNDTIITLWHKPDHSLETWSE